MGGVLGQSSRIGSLTIAMSPQYDPVYVIRAFASPVVAGLVANTLPAVPAWRREHGQCIDARHINAGGREAVTAPPTSKGPKAARSRAIRDLHTSRNFMTEGV
jgi:hypothetical protein